MEIMLGKERWRWSLADKRRIILETFEAGATCHLVARRHQLSSGFQQSAQAPPARRRHSQRSRDARGRRDWGLGAIASVGG